MKKLKQPLRIRHQGFTIVELLIVIVVIAILAAITIVAYNGIQQRARAAVVQSDLQSTATKLANENTLTGAFFPGTVDVAHCGDGLDKSAGTTYQCTIDTTANTYCLTATNGGISYYISSASNSPIKGACAGHVDGGAASLPPPVTWTQLVAGDSFSAGLRSDGSLYAWGINPTGQFGNNATSSTAASLPQAAVIAGVTSGSTITKLGAVTSSSSSATIGAIDSTGSAYGWGYNNYGQTGVGTTTTPIKVPTKLTAFSGKTITQIAAGLWHSVALDSTGKVYTWGDGTTAGQLGNGTTTSSLSPVAITGGALAGKTVTAVAAGWFHTLALDSTGKVYAWGNGAYGQLGDGTALQRLSPVAVSTAGALSGKTIVAIAAAGRVSLALDSTGKVYAWGQNSNGEVGDGTATERDSPVAVVTTGALSGKTITAISSANSKSMALDSTGQIYAWGDNTYGQIGDGTTTSRPSPTPVTGMASKTIVSISSSSTHSLAIDSTGKAYAWGLNASGQLGDGTTTNRPTPVLVTNP